MTGFMGGVTGPMSQDKMLKEMELMNLDMLDRYLGEICKFYGGPKKPVVLDPLTKMYDDRNYAGIVKYIKDNLLLRDLKLTLAKVKSGGPPKALAWVPKIYIAYGTKDFKEAEVIISIRKDYLENASLDAIVSTISHELTHLVLDSTFNPLRDSEIATELTAMCLGYHEFFLRDFEAGNRLTKMKHESILNYLKRAYGLVSKTVTYEKRGYLSTPEIRYAYNWIKKRLKT